MVEVVGSTPIAPTSLLKGHAMHGLFLLLKSLNTYIYRYFLELIEG